MEKGFQAAYSQLNQAQKKAVDNIDGPLLVVAGPGTGKTQLLSLRVANILRRTDTDPASILCLTFTNSAATNMQQRLNDLIGPSAHRVHVSTFHSFAAELMQLYPDYFWSGARLGIVPDALQLDILQALLQKLPLDNPLAIRFADSFTSLNDVQQALRLAKEAGLSPQKLKAMLEVNETYIDLIEPKLTKIVPVRLSLKQLDDLVQSVSSLPDQVIEPNTTPLTSLSTVIKSELVEAVKQDEASGKTRATGLWKRKWIQNLNGQRSMFNERRRNNWWQALSSVYADYRQALHSRGYYDYSDMIIEVISQLEQNPELLADVQERFLYVLIDEFQDANAAQLRLAHLVGSHYVDEGRPNLMAVGDDDQSIFAFNGAELNNMLIFTRNYKDTKTIVLTNNYRSSQAILNTAETIINQASDRLVNRLPNLTKKLKAVNDRPNSPIKHLSYPTREHQLTDLAKRIAKVWLSDSNQSLAVLARSHASLKQICFYLQKEGVAVSYEQQNNILEQPLIQQVSLLAEIVSAINNGDEARLNHHLSRLLSHPAWKVSPIELWRIATSNKDSAKHWLDSLLRHKKKSLNNIAKWLLWLSNVSQNEPLPVTMEYLIGLRAGQYLTSPLRQYFLSTRLIESNYLDSISGLNVLNDLVKEFAGTGIESLRLNDFVRFMRLNRDLKRPIVDPSWFVSGERSVQLLTVHKAKGLEFDTVYLIDGIDKEWLPKRVGRQPPANLPLQPYGENFDDYARLAYVAATRARRSFIVTSFTNDIKGQSVLASPLFSAIELTSLELSKPTRQEVVSALESNLSWPTLNSADSKALLKPRLNEYQLSATGLLQFLDVANQGPQYFLERQLLRLPEITTANMAYGTAMHKAMQTAQNLTNVNKFNLKKVLDSFEEALVNQPVPSDSLKRYLPHGKGVLDHLFQEANFKLPDKAQTEVLINNLQPQAVPLAGTLDHVYSDGNQLIITDYKTGSPLTSFETRAAASAIKAWRQHTQLIFYSLLAMNSQRFRAFNKIKARIVYLEAENPKHLILSLEPSSDEVARLGQLVQAVWQTIINFDFPRADLYPKNIEGIKEFEAKLIKGK